MSTCLFLFTFNYVSTAAKGKELKIATLNSLETHWLQGFKCLFCSYATVIDHESGNAYVCVPVCIFKPIGISVPVVNQIICHYKGALGPVS